MENNHYLYIEPNSEAEDYFVNDLLPQTKDEVKIDAFAGCHIYVITDNDFHRIRNYLKKGA